MLKTEQMNTCQIVIQVWQNVNVFSDANNMTMTFIADLTSRCHEVKNETIFPQNNSYWKKKLTKTRVIYRRKLEVGVTLKWSM